MEPKLRIKGYSGEWKPYRISEIGKTYSGITGKAKEDFGVGSAQYITFLNVLNNALIDVSILEPVNIQGEDRQNTVHKGDLFFNTSSETPEEVGMCATIDEDIPNLYLNSFCFGFRLLGSMINPACFTYMMRGPVGRGIMSVLAQGATRYNLSKKAFCKVDVFLPTDFKEQEDIGYFFNSFTSLISESTKRLESLRQFKSASLRAMFPDNSEAAPKVRFVGFKEDWRKTTLGRIATITKGQQINKVNLTSFGEYYVLNGGIGNSGYTNMYNTEKNTISISEGGNSCGYVKFNFERFWSGGHNYTLQDVQISNEYLYSYLKMVEKEIMKKRVGSGLPNIQKSALLEFPVYYPVNSKEQRRIGAFFLALDKQIDLQEKLTEMLQHIKAACLDQMFV